MLITNKPTVFNPTFKFINFLYKLILSEKNSFFHIFHYNKATETYHLFKLETSWFCKSCAFLEPTPKDTDTLGGGVSRHPS